MRGAANVREGRGEEDRMSTEPSSNARRARYARSHYRAKSHDEGHAAAEEQALSSGFGEAYDAYRATTPRWLRLPWGGRRG